MQSGVPLACSMWAMTAVCLTLVALRLYTRIRVIHFVGAEDHMYAWTGVFLLVFTVAIQVSVHYGLGRNFWTLAPTDSSRAIFWTYVANSFAITGNAMAKLSMGLFLLRVVQLRWHKVALWVLVGITASTSIALTVMLWNQATPVKASWDVLRTPGHWKIKIQPMSVCLGVWSSICDFFFAIFPWLFIWSLRMPRREKIFLATGMSLGVIAGVCGIIRTVVLSQLNVSDYTINFVPYFAWAAAEIAVSMICLGIPTLRPLYLKYRGLSPGHMHEDEEAPNRLPQFTMCQSEVDCSHRRHGQHQNYHHFQDTIADSEAGSSANSASCASPPMKTMTATMMMTMDKTMPAEPPKAYVGTTEDSVDEIIGLYNEHRGGEKSKDGMQQGKIPAGWPLSR